MATTTPIWFDTTNYLNVKTEQLNTAKFKGKNDWTNAATNAALADAGLSPYEHFEKYGNAENISPNNMFNVAEYLLSKAKQLNAEKFEGKTDWTEASVMSVFQTVGLSAWDHYTLYGTAEGINPSNAFDTKAYMNAKLAQLKAADPAGNWTTESMIAAFTAAGLNPLQHYQLYGKAEGLSISAVAHDKIVISNFNPYNPLNPGGVFTLTTARDTITGTAANDTINGVASSLTNEQTINNVDVINGGTGIDTLNINMKGSFNGFTTGSMTNVEIVNLTNTGSIPQSFDAKGITGVETYNINATGSAVSLKNLESAANLTVNVNSQAQDNADIEFTAKAVEGTNDSLNLGLNRVGTAKVGTTAQMPVTVTANGIENLNVKVTDTNIVNLTNAATKSITAFGAGSLTVAAVNTALTSFDATNVIGNVTADLSAITAGGLKTIKGGNGDDTFSVTSAGLAPNATIDGGLGNDVLKLSATTSYIITDLNMKGIETLELSGNNTVNFSGKNVSGLQNLTLTGTNDVTLANVQAPAFTINAQGATAGSVVTDTTTPLTYNTVAGTTKTNAISTAITASKASTATVNVGVDTQVGGIFNFAAATGVTVNVAQSFAADGTTENTKFGGTINANNAATLNVNAKGLLNATNFNVAEATSVTVVAEKGSAGIIKLAAGKATDVSITAGAKLDISGSDLGSAQNVTLVQNEGALTTGSGSNHINLASLGTLNVSGAGTGSGKLSTITLGNLGAAGRGYGLTVNASGLKGNFYANNVAAGTYAVNLNLADVTGYVIVSDITGGDITINAPSTGTLRTNDITASGNVLINAMGVVGGSKTAKAVTTGDITTGANKTVTLNFDGNNDMSFKSITVGTAGTANTGSITIDASGYAGNTNNTTTLTDAADANFGDIKADTVVFKGSKIGINTFDSSGDFVANTFTFTGGLGVDKVNVTGFGGTGKAMTVNLNTGVGLDVMKVFAHADNTSVTITGDLGGNNDTIDVTGGAATTKLDISRLSGYLTGTLTGGARAETIVGGAGNDTIKADGGVITSISINDILTGGAGNDTFVLNTLGAVGSDAGITATITDFGNGIDRIQGFGSGVGPNVLVKSGLVRADFDTLWTAIRYYSPLEKGVTKIILGMVGNDTYAFHVTVGDPSGDTPYAVDTDSIVRLVGVTVDSITTADFIA